MLPHRRFLVLALLLSTLGWLFPASTWSQQPVQSARQGGPTIRRMQILETPRTGGQKAAFTIVGAVPQSAVYLSDNQRLPLERLVDAAGGLAPAANPSLRVIRNGQLSQVLFDRTQPQHTMLFAGDVVVVSSTDGNGTALAEPSIPVACLGLTDRPVVLPLEPSTTSTLSDLVRRLLQSPELAQTARVISPLSPNSGGPNERLIPGTVIFFDSRLVNPYRLSQTEALPPAIDLDLPAQLPPAPPVTHEQFLADPQSLAEWFEPAPSRVDMAAEHRQPLVSPRRADSTTGVEAPAPRPSNEFSVTTLANVAPQPEETNETEELDKSLVTPAGSILMTEKFEPAQPFHFALDPTPNLNPPPAGLSQSQVISEPDRSRQRNLDEATVQAKPLAPVTSHKTVPVWTIARSVSLVLLFGLCGAIGWSEWIRRNQLQQSARLQSHLAGVNAEDSSPAHDVHNLLNRSVEVFEEQTTIANQRLLHGQVVGHRRIMLNAAHETLDGPHFARTGQPQKAMVAASKPIDERTLRRTLRELFRSTSVTQESGWGGTLEVVRPAPETPNQSFNHQSVAPHADFGSHLPVEPSMSPPHAKSERFIAPAGESDGPSSYDIVQPPSLTSSPASKGPLERVLRTLASEKRG